MAINLKVIGDSARKPITEPRAIFSALPDRVYPYLRHEQGEVLERWYERRDARDLVVKQNTGGGKTIIGLLIGQSALNDNTGRVVYLAPDTYLAAQATTEAGRLGLASTADPRDAAFLSGQAILITTFQKVVNAKSVFGVAGTGRPVVDLGMVIVDDAHAALAAAESQFKINIPRSHPAYGQLSDLFATVLSEQSRRAAADIREGETTAVLRVPFTAWSTAQDKVMGILHPHRKDAELEWGWPLVADVLAISSVTITHKAIEIRPSCPPIEKIPAFAQAKHRVYLTATLADDSVLVTDLDADPASVSTPVTPGRASDLGNRMILAPMQLNPSLDETAIRKLARQYADGDRNGDGEPDSRPVNVVVLVPSDKAAAKWRDLADRTLHVGDLQAGVAELKAGHVGLVVMVNKYDGVDLAGNACELLVLDGVPTALDSADRREAAVLSGSTTLIGRQVQRIEQGMGRGVRDGEDHCVVLLIGSELAFTLNDPGRAAMLSPATRAQVELSAEIGAQIADGGLAELREAIELCLEQDGDWKRISRERLAQIEYNKTSTVHPWAIARRRAFDAAAIGQYEQAALTLQDAINSLPDDKQLRGWLREEQATYLQEVDAGRAQQVLTNAIADNPAVLRPVVGISPARVKALSNQAKAAAEYMSARFVDGNSLLLGVRALLDQITWDEDRTDDAEAAWDDLGQLLGFATDRPDKNYGTGPDNLWILNGQRHGVFELKTGSASSTISKRDVDQLGGSVRWDLETYGDDHIAVPVSMHPSNVVSRQGTAPDGMRVITPATLDALKDAVMKMITALASVPNRWADPVAVAEELGRHSLGGNTVINKYTVASKSE